ncbi:MAG: sigma-54-dependent Fis family transcriptional regulator [Flavobacteriales bacterium]|nr:sigma-54-dependent Fis family transcriptional regulator [Flavobacteriales bacterium]
MSQEQSKLLIIDDDQDVLLSAKMVLKRHVDIVRTSNDPSNIDEYLSHDKYDAILLDMNFTVGAIGGKEGFHWLSRVKEISPETQVILMTAYGDIDIAVRAMKEGATDFVVKPWDNERLRATVASAIRLGRSEKEIKNLKRKTSALTKDMDQPFSDMIGQSETMQEVFSTIRKVAKTDVNVLILGENGTGKEVVARALHRSSLRNDQIFVNVDLGAITESLFESELFGHAKGAFTDAKEARAGRFELAHQGTLFLDEIGNLSMPMQAKLLTALQNRMINRVGESKPRKVDIRLVCATNMPLYDMVESAEFRQDLLYRINTVEIVLPPLRERQDDIPVLADHFLKMYSKKYQKNQVGLSKDGLRKLQRYSWPGNIRELQHVLERAVIMSDGPELAGDDFVLQGREVKVVEDESLNLEDVEKKAIISAIKKHDSNMSAVAKELGLGRTTLYRKMAKYGI